MYKYLIIIGIFVLLPPYAQAGSDLTHAVRKYDFYWGGLHVGTLVGSIERQKDMYAFETHIAARGVAEMVSKYKSKTVSFINALSYKPMFFRNESTLRKRSRTITIHANDVDGVIEETVTPPDNRAKRPAVPEPLKKDFFDPLTAAFMSRQKVLDYLEGVGPDEFTLPLYDARRRDDLHFKIVGEKNIHVKHKPYHVVHMRFYREAVAGVTRNELKRSAQEEPIIDVYLNKDDQLLPIKIEGEAPMGSAVALLSQKCDSISSCPAR